MVAQRKSDAPGGGVAGILCKPCAQAAVLVLVALALKATTFGDPNRSADEMFYFLVGQRMHEGLLPYVDVWDRKPLGLFLIYYLIAGISFSVWSYQIVACLGAALTAWLIARMVSDWTDRAAGLLAGVSYLLVIVMFEGATGQSPDFYGPLIAGAALLVLTETRRGEARLGWRGWTAMALCGVAITIKQTTLFESVFLGLWLLAGLRRHGAPAGRIAGTAALCAVIGALPMALIAGYYWQAGHWAEFWHAMVTSNFAKAAPGRKLFRLTTILLRLAIVLPFAVWGLLAVRGDANREAGTFAALWLCAALAGFLSVPNFFGHYTLPVLVPLSVAVGLLFGRKPYRLLLFTAVAVYALIWQNPLRGEATARSAQGMAAAARLIREGDNGGGLLVFDGPSYLYALADEPFLSPLAFPHHLADGIENDVSHLNTHAEVDRILAGGPSVVVMARDPLITPINLGSRARVLAYVRARCRTRKPVLIRDASSDVRFVVFGRCRPG